MAEQGTDPRYDVAVVGGGITGAGVARDAALRGLSCVLLEKGDYASGTSSRTTHLVHGGLRYLERAELHLVSESLREREILLQLAPHLIHPLPILLPVFRGDRRKLWQIRSGLLLYDLLSLGKGTPHYAVLNSRTTLRKAPFLSPRGLVGSGLFYDYQITLPERLVLENVLSARDHGALCLNHHEVTRIEDAQEGFRLSVRNHLGGDDLSFLARVVVNAAGPWADRVSASYKEGLARKVFLTKGAHIVVDADMEQAVFTSSPRDQRLFFTLPMEGLTLVGTTDTVYDGDLDTVVADPGDVEYLLDGVRKLLPGREFTRSDVLWSYAGLRPLAAKVAGRSPSSVSRRHVLHREGPGQRFLTIVGGKYTTFRKMAEDAVDAACHVLGRPVPGKTDQVPLFGGGMRDRVVFRESLLECTRRLPNLARQTVDHMVGLYGRRCHEVIDLGLGECEWFEPVAPGYADTRAQVLYSVRREDARHLDDMILRRLRMSVAPDRGLTGADPVSRLMADALGWDESTRKQEIERFRACIALEMEAGFGRG